MHSSDCPPLGLPSHITSWVGRCAISGASLHVGSKFRIRHPVPSASDGLRADSSVLEFRVAKPPSPFPESWLGAVEPEHQEEVFIGARNDRIRLKSGGEEHPAIPRDRARQMAATFLCAAIALMSISFVSDALLPRDPHAMHQFGVYQIGAV